MGDCAVMRSHLIRPLWAVPLAPQPYGTETQERARTLGLQPSPAQCLASLPVHRKGRKCQLRECDALTIHVYTRGLFNGVLITWGNSLYLREKETVQKQTAHIRSICVCTRTRTGKTPGVLFPIKRLHL